MHLIFNSYVRLVFTVIRKCFIITLGLRANYFLAFLEIQSIFLFTLPLEFDFQPDSVIYARCEAEGVNDTGG